jgi:purine-nucleoside/S-methyl-5'-thioadenosine phosphorylase / adenosine deaminase
VSTSELPYALPGGGHALFTARAHGNMSSLKGEGAEYGERARERLRTRVGVARSVRGHQVHGARVRRVTGAESDLDGCDVAADGHATALAGVGVMVLTADCLPVALGCSGAVAMLHAGWRGLAAGVLEEGVLALEEVGGRGEIVAVIGPAAGLCCYEVGPEVHAALGNSHRDGRRIDLRAVAHERLLAAGVARVTEVAACTICDERFFSHRRERERAGRQAGIAWLS